MVKRLDHVGIVVRNLEKSMKPYQELLGLPLHEIEEVNVEGAVNRVAFFPLGETEIELVHTTAAAGLAADFLRERGEGVHHLAFEVDDVQGMVSKLLAQGVEFLWEGRIIPGSRGTKVAFFAPDEFNGIYIELVQKPDSPVI